MALERDAREGMLLGFVLLLEISNLEVVFAHLDLLQRCENYCLYGNNDLFILQLVKCFILSISSVKAFFRVYNQTASKNTHYLHIL